MAKARKPTPSMLGRGSAAKAGRALSGRQRQLDAMIEAAEGGKSKAPPKKSTSKRK